MVEAHGLRGPIAAAALVALALAGCSRTSLDVTGHVEGATLPDTSTCDQLAASSRRVGTSDDLESTAAVAVAANCSVLIGGIKRGGNGGLFVHKIHADGTTLLTRQWGSRDGNLLYGLTFDEGGGFVLVANVQAERSINFGGATLTASDNNGDIVMASFTTLGAHRWSKRFGGPGHHETGDLALDANGNIILAAEVADPVDFGGGTLTPAGSWDLAFASFDSNGKHRWSRLIGNEDIQISPRLATTSEAIWIAGYMEGVIDFGGVVLATASSEDGYIAKLELDGATSQAFLVGGEGKQRILDVAAGPAGVAVVGEFDSEVAIDGQVVVSDDDEGTFVAQFDPLGNLRWVNGINGRTALATIAMDADGRVVVTGSFRLTMEVNGQIFETSDHNDSDTYVVTYAADGSVARVEIFGDDLGEYPLDIATLPGGGYVIGGTFEGTINFDKTLVSAGEHDAFAAIRPQ
jgi:hypothetical protein